ncbi:MAG: hypothetical protein IJ719_12655 [Clostridia bacterium]|nr:hypothetical protein [Clostridia bacterium]
MAGLAMSRGSLPVMRFKSKEDRIRFFEEAKPTEAEKELQRKAWELFNKDETHSREIRTKR